MLFLSHEDQPSRNCICFLINCVYRIIFSPFFSTCVCVTSDIQLRPQIQYTFRLHLLFGRNSTKTAFFASRVVQVECSVDREVKKLAAGKHLGMLEILNLFSLRVKMFHWL